MPWHVAQPGPDWTDVRSSMMEIEEGHLCTCYVHLQPLGRSVGVEWHVICVAALIGVWNEGSPRTYAVGGNWPNRESKSLSAFVYAMLTKLDWDLGSGQHINNDRPA